MTPPKRTCSSIEEDTVLVSRSVPRTIPTPVSSQEDSMPSTSGWGAVHGAVCFLGAGRARSRFREPGELEPHDQGVDAVAVVPAPDVDLFEAEAAVELLRPGVVRPDLQQHILGAAPPAFRDELGEQGGADALAFLLGHDGDGLDVRDRLDAHQPGVAHDRRRAARPPGSGGSRPAPARRGTSAAARRPRGTAGVPARGRRGCPRRPCPAA